MTLLLLKYLLQPWLYLTFYAEGDEGGGDDGAADGQGTGDGGDGGGAGDEGAQGDAGLSENWREQWSGGDEKIANLMGRYTSPAEVGKALLNANQRINSGDLIPKPSENATDEEIKAYREAIGVPDKPDGYDVSDMKLSEDEQTLLKGFFEAAHSANMPPEAVKQVLEWNRQSAAALEEERQNMDAEQKQSAEDALHQEWGGAYRGNMNAVMNMLDGQLPEDVRDAFKEARLSDGTKILNHPGMVQAMANMALAINPAATVLPGSEGNPMGSVTDRMKEIQSKMGTPEYTKNEDLQKEYRDLYAKLEKINPEEARKIANG